MSQSKGDRNIKYVILTKHQLCEFEHLPRDGFSTGSTVACPPRGLEDVGLDMAMNTQASPSKVTKEFLQLGRHHTTSETEQHHPPATPICCLVPSADAASLEPSFAARRLAQQFGLGPNKLAEGLELYNYLTDGCGVRRMGACAAHTWCVVVGPVLLPAATCRRRCRRSAQLPWGRRSAQVPWGRIVPDTGEWRLNN